LIVDDEPLALERLKVAFRDMPGAVLVGEASDGVIAAERIRELQPDLVLLDVQMPGLDGMQLAASLDAHARPEIVFVTAYQQYAPDAFDVEAADYLLKPVRFDRLKIAIERARRRREARAALAPAEPPPPAPSAYDTEIWAPTARGLARVPVEQIVWIEAAGDYAMLHTESRSFMIRATMTALQGRLDPEELTRVHRSAFVRLSVVRTVRRLGKGLIALVLPDGSEVHVGPNYTQAVLAALKAIPVRASA
jgi:DNA-binding LytR/AlgR family response regulator